MKGGEHPELCIPVTNMTVGQIPFLTVPSIKNGTVRAFVSEYRLRLPGLVLMSNSESWFRVQIELYRA